MTIHTILQNIQIVTKIYEDNNRHQGANVGKRIIQCNFIIYCVLGGVAIVDEAARWWCRGYYSILMRFRTSPEAHRKNKNTRPHPLFRMTLRT